jgi:hypothetical protein
MIYPIDSRNLSKRAAIRTVIGFCFLSFLLNVIGLIGSDYTTFAWMFLSCNAKIYLQEELSWEGCVLLSVLGISVLLIITSLLVIAPIARGIRVRRLQRQARLERPQISRMERLLKFLRRNKSIAAVVLIAVTFIITLIPVFLGHLLKWLHAATNPRFILFAEIFASLNLVLNPVTYAVVMLPFLQFYEERLARLWRQINITETLPHP